MENYCSGCGKKLREGVIYCPKCGKKVGSLKKEGNGISIVGLILGIIAIFWTFLEIMSISTISSPIDGLITSYDLPRTYLLFCFAFGFTIGALIPSIIGTILSIIGMSKKIQTNNIIGIILNSISLLSSLIIYVIILSY